MALMDFFKRKSEPAETEIEYSAEIAASIRNEFVRRQQERKPWELQWRLNAEFLNGNQYLDIDPYSLTLQDIPKMYDHQEREVFNQIATIFETRTAKITRQRPLLKTRPASSDDGDISTAKVSSMLLNSTWDDQGMDDKYNLFAPWLELTGTCFLKPAWNIKKGRVVAKRLIPSYDEDEPKLEGEIETESEDEKLGRNVIEEIVREGDLDTTVVPSYEIFPDSCWRDSVQQCRSIIHARAYHVDDVFDTWDVRVEPESVDVATLKQSQNGLGGLGYSTSTFRGGLTTLKNHCVVIEYYEQPSRKYPKGRFIVVAGDKTLYVGTLPYVLGEDEQPELPIVRAVAINHPGCFWGKSIIERLIPVQRRYNAVRNRRAEYLNLVGVGQWYKPEGSLHEDSELNNAPGNVIEYIPINGDKPMPVQFPPLPPDFSIEERSLMAEFTSISGVSELSRFSEAPSGVKSGVALGIASEQDDTRIATTISNVANAVVLLGKYWIRMYRQFVQEPRMLRYVGFSKQVEVKQWYVSDLRSDDVIIENSTALAESPSQRRQMVFDLMNSGLFNRDEKNPFTPEGRQKIFQMLEFGDWEGGGDDLETLQKSRARKENMQIISGQLQQPLPIMDFDDDLIHLEQHDRMRMSAEYETILQSPMGPLVNQLMLHHKQQHMARYLQAQKAQQMQAILAQAKALPQRQGVPAKGGLTINQNIDQGRPNARQGLESTATG